MFRYEMIDFLYDSFGLEVSPTTISRTLKTERWTRKTNGRVAKQRNLELRELYLYKLSDCQSYQLVFIDESGCDKRSGHRRQGWAPSGATPVQVDEFNREQRFQILAAYTQSGVKLARIYRGSTDAVIFEDFIDQLLHHCGKWPEPNSVLNYLAGPVGLFSSMGLVSLRIELGRYATYVDVALGLTRHWTLNKLQSMAALLPAAFLDERGTRLQEEGGRQHFQYIGGEGGTGKSRVIHAIKDMFRLKDGLHTLLLTGASGNAAALIGGVTLHSAANIAQVGGLTLAAVDSRLKQYTDDQHRPFGGIPMVMFFGDFFQFDPVLQTSLLLPTPRDPGGQRPDSSAKHLAAHKLFLQFTNVVILREQSSFVDGLRAITPLNQDRWDLNMAAVVRWARAHGKHISIFVAKHDTESGKRLSAGDLCHVLRYGDDSQLPTPGLFFYAQGMPVVVTRNQFVGLKVVNGAPFKAVDIFPDLAAGTIALASDVTLHLGPPVAVLLQSDDSAGLAIPGLPNGTILIKSKTVAIPSQMRGKEGRWRGKPGFRWVTHRTGPLCTPAFAMTDQKSQGKQFSNVLINLKGVHSSGTATLPSFMSLYVQLSRAQSWDGLHLFRKPARGDFIEPKNVLDKDMREAILKLERRGEETRRRFEQDHRHESWFQEWAAMPESGRGRGALAAHLQQR
ncbi:hypothetical protein CHGG_05380 [Chaetomium globosum CBS 148.51]|uniref:Tc1-like transposase DDE domain-containing protein n=1 Tax=Chaetomium globosum (strain ATCC 6205 / CBS 148.51 / DSM 1962 / NBRC 6347 / NRRL 1970) TaxID=306901 RepID=Q2H7I5_CHAGB|nr:uncharacterized protein CHGG_05380 [Chaetomium globosum CBS 148.51]EAQ88761.1 hypothetical protein CHGG_05380 [Chaetomium globosum CBS 148.51]